MRMAAFSLAASKLLRRVLASTARCLPALVWATVPTHERNAVSNPSGSSAANTRPNVPRSARPFGSWLGIPCGRSRNPRNHSSFESPNSSISFQPSAPQMTAQIAMTRMPGPSGPDVGPALTRRVVKLVLARALDAGVANKMEAFPDRLAHTGLQSLRISDMGVVGCLRAPLEVRCVCPDLAVACACA